ncbi:hypothetical protein ABB26_06815 [Stenotrophomonas humi]|uniref:Uncharacterized protein n=2 Tax=Stenotrophomonas humi TaxID=405444 RepID=A0A0R0CI97_9GAMM|nr:hypothetical protein ABB26_06815 [Stenotrophomonas humi]
MSLVIFRCATMALVLHATCSSAAAQQQVSPPALSAEQATLTEVTEAVPAIPSGTPVFIEIAEPLASSTHKRGDIFAITLAEPLLLDGVERLPRGTRGTGQIIHAAAARGGGAPGELLIAARTLETAQGPLLLRGFKLGASGEDNTGMALGVSLAAGPFAMFIRGREIVIPAGTRGIAKTKTAPTPATSAPPVAAPGADIEVQGQPSAASAIDQVAASPGNIDATAVPAVTSQPETPVQPKE